MSEQEKPVRVTRAAAKKRAATSTISSGQPTKKNRTVLGEITNSVAMKPKSDPEPQKPKPKPRARSKKKEEKEVMAVGVKNVESQKSDDPQLCVPYASDIYVYLHSMEMEEKRRPLTNYIEKVQRDVTANMRGILVDWLVEVAEEYKLVSDTLYLTVSYLDRYLSLIPLNRQRLQLLGVSCMLIASKYEEISPPHVEDYCYITDNTYTKQEVVKMETDILKFLNFEMGNPTIKTFLRRFTKVAQEKSESSDLRFEFLGSYLAELSLLDYPIVQFLPSVIAASVIFLAKFTLKPEIRPWNLMLHQHSGYRPSDLKDCVCAIHDLQSSRKAGNLVAVRDKYKQHKFKCVSMLSSPPEIPAVYFEDVKQ